LIEPAQNGDETAIAALVQVALDPSKSAYWSLAVAGLEAAAEAGNGPAIQTLATLVNSNDVQVRNQARTALEVAAENGFQEADAALETQTLR
jgi:TPR repeat protein